MSARRKRSAETVEFIPPKILGPSESDDCERCRDEPAEYRVRMYWPKGPLDFDLCGTCFLEWKNDAGRTWADSTDYWHRKIERKEIEI